MDDDNHESFVRENKDPLIRFLNKIIVLVVKLLAILMVVVIVWGAGDVLVHLFQRMSAWSTSFLNVELVVSSFGIFLAILIAIEIFLNIVFYLSKDAIHVPLVLATALTAVARKVIILDYTSASSSQIYATAAIIFAVGIVYWLVTKKSNTLGSR